MLLLKFILVTASITWFFCLSKAFKPVREWITGKRQDAQTERLEPNKLKLFFWSFWDKLLDCYACTGFWASIPAYYIVYWKIEREIILYQFIGSFCALILLTFHMKYLERK